MDDIEQIPHHPMVAIKHINTVFQSSCNWDIIVKIPFSETGGAPGATRGSEEALHFPSWCTFF